MNSVRTMFGLAVGIAALVAAHFFVDVRTAVAPKGFRRTALVPSAEKADVLSVARAGESETRMVSENGWKIVKPYVASAEQRAVLRLTDALSFAPISDEMTDVELLRIGRTRRDFGLDSPRVVVTVADFKSRKPTMVCFGQSTPAGDGVYVTVDDVASVYVVSSNVFSAVNLDTSGFRRRRVLDVEPADIVSFDIKNGTRHFVRVVRVDNAWKVSEPCESIASSSRVSTFLDAVVRLEAQSFVWPMGVTNEASHLSEALLAGYGFLEESVAVVTLKSSGGRDRAVSFGKESGGGRVYALTPDGNVVTVPRAVRDAALAGMSAFSDSRLFPVDAAAARAISVDDGGIVYLLSRNAEGLWRLDAPVSAMADQDAVAGLVGRLLSVRFSDVDASGVRVSIGTNAEPVSVSRAAILAGTRPEDWHAKTMVKIDPSMVKRIVVTDKGKDSVSVLFDVDRKVWGLERPVAATTVDDAAVAKLLATLKRLDSVRVERLRVSDGDLGVYGLDKPIRTIAVDQTTEGAVRRNVLIGDVTDGGRYATLGASDAVFVIPPESAAALLAPMAK